MVSGHCYHGLSPLWARPVHELSPNKRLFTPGAFLKYRVPSNVHPYIRSDKAHTILINLQIVAMKYILDVKPGMSHEIRGLGRERRLKLRKIKKGLDITF